MHAPTFSRDTSDQIKAQGVRPLTRIAFVASALIVGVGAGVAVFVWSRGGGLSDAEIRAYSHHAEALRGRIAKDDRFLGITVRVETAGEGAIHISGYVGQNEDLDALKQVVKLTAPAGAVVWNVRVVGLIPAVKRDAAGS